MKCNRDQVSLRNGGGARLLRRQGTRWVPFCGFGFLLLLTLTPRPLDAASISSDARASVLALPAAPGSVRGLADAANLQAFTGQVDFRVPLDLPEGIQGQRPNLALEYDGGLGNGPLGLGWHLAIPQVRLILQTGVPGYSGLDPMELSGLPGAGRLVPLKNQMYSVSGQGRKIQAHLQVGGGWNVYDGTGTHYTLGSSDSSRRTGARGTDAWFIDRSEDAAGHVIRYIYQKVSGDRQLTRIVWGPDEAFALEFIYEDRPDKATSWRSGHEIRTGSRLAELRVTARGERLRLYRLKYETDADLTALSRLVSIQQFGQDEQHQRPPTLLGYTQRAEAKVVQLTAVNSGPLRSVQANFADIDGDGLADAVNLPEASWRRNLGNGLFAVEASLNGLPRMELDQALFADLDGDGQVELIRMVRHLPWTIFERVGDVWRIRSRWGGTEGLLTGNASCYLGDLNGDGQLDLVRYGAWGVTIYRGGPKGVEKLHVLDHMPFMQQHHNWMRWLDVNGDGLLDWVGLTREQMHVGLGRGDGTFAPAQSFPLPQMVAGGDPSRWMLADLNRDGFVDLVDTVGSNVRWFRGLPSGGVSFFPRIVEAPITSTSSVALADINGNGSIDLVWSSGWAVDVAGTTTAGMLTDLDNGLGQTTEIRYDNTSALAVAASAAGRPWQHRLHLPLPVAVQLIHRTAPDETPEQVNLLVRDPQWDPKEHSFAGFLESEQTTVGDTAAATLVERVRYHSGLSEDRVLRGQAFWTERGSADRSMLLQRTQMQWSALDVKSLEKEYSGDSSTRRYLKVAALQASETDHAADTPASVVVRSRYEYDDEGRQVLVSHLGRTDQDDDTTQQRTIYADQDTPWARDVVVELQTLDAAGTAQARIRHHFDGGSKEAKPWGTVQFGRLRRIEAYLGEEARWVQQLRRDYDAHGNATQLWENGTARQITYDAQGLHPVAEVVAPTAGRELRWSLHWDPVLNLPVRLTGPDGHSDWLRYDPLGRVISVARDNAAPHLLYAYDWLAPQPTLTTYWHDGAAGERVQVAVHDGRGLLRWRASQLGAGSWHIDGVRRYDGRGQLASLSEPFSASSPLLEDATPPPGPRLQLTYDALGRCTKTRLPNRAVRRQQYGPLEETLMMPGLAPVRQVRDGLGRLIRTERTINDRLEWATARYDARGLLLERALQGNQVVQSFTYDGLGRLVASQDPENGQRRQLWSDPGWLRQTVNGAGQIQSYEYDGMGRTTRIEHQNGPGLPTEAFTLHYDEGPHAEPAAGHLVQVDEPWGQIALSYDRFGRQVGLRREVAGQQFTEHRSLSPAGLLLSTSYDNMPPISRQYDLLGRLIQLGTYWSAAAYNLDGTVDTAHYGNGVVQHSTYDAMHLLNGVDVYTPTGVPLYQIGAEYTRFGALSTVVDRHPKGLGQDASYTYDIGARLTGAVLGETSWQYAYDALQNRTERSYEGPAVLPVRAGIYRYGGSPKHSPRQLREADGTHFDYDGAGRIAAMGDRTMRYGADDRLREVRGQDLLVAYSYGYDGQQVLARADAHPDQSLVRFSPEVYQTGAHRSYQLTANGRPVVRLDVPTMAAADTVSDARSTVTYLHPTLATGAALTTDALAELGQIRRSEPFGVVLEGDVKAHPFNQDSKHVDAHTGWADHGARWLAPEIGQWLSPNAPHMQPDPSALAHFWDLHPYQYARQSPTLFEDPDGNAVNLIAALGFAAGGAASGAGHYAVMQLLSGQSIEARPLLAAAVGGGLTGGLIGLTGGASLLASKGAIVLGSSAERAILRQGTTLVDVGMGIVTSGIGSSRGSENYRSVKSAKIKKSGSRSTFARGPDGAFLPHPQAKGRPHSIEGTRRGQDDIPDKQRVTFGDDGKILGRVDFSSHGRVGHPAIHFHPAVSPYSFSSEAPPYLPDFTFKSRK